MVVHFFLVLEDAVEDVAYLCAHGMAHDALYAVAAVGAAGSDGLRQLGHLVAVGADVSCQVVLEVALLAAIAQGELNTAVEYLTGIDEHGTAFAHDAHAGHVNQNVGGLFVVPVEGAVDAVS